MCGIIGYVGNGDAAPFLIEGLLKLEYRGYDSAGVAVHDGEKIGVVKTKGRISALVKKLEETPVSGHLGIGHTRWATHGEPNDVNSHPQFNENKTIAVVHNGIIENYMDIKRELQKKGYHFISDTDTETAAHLIDFYYRETKDILSSILKTMDRIEGAYALGVLHADYPDAIFAARKDSPLVISCADGVGFLSSDVSALLKYTREFIFLDDMEIACITKTGLSVYGSDKRLLNKEIKTIDWDVEAAEKGGFEHFMLKEIFEQPKVIRDTFATRIKNSRINLDDVFPDPEELKSFSRIYIVACGTAYYAGLIGKQLIERYCRMPVVSDYASEFRYGDPIIDDKTLLILISQSGETADTLAALRMGKARGATVLSVVNVLGSSIARESDRVIYTLAGPEICVASTKAFTAQISTMYLLAFYMALSLGKLTPDEFSELSDELAKLPSLAGKILEQSNRIKRIAESYMGAKNVFYVGRGLDFVVSMEGSLKLKEIAYLHSEPYAAGELKHGPLALIEPSTLVIGTVTQEEIAAKTASNLKECKARGARILSIAMEGNEDICDYTDEVFYIPRIHHSLSPVLSVIPLQLFAYYVAAGLGHDVDKPRNLAKSVTVE